MSDEPLDPKSPPTDATDKASFRVKLGYGSGMVKERLHSGTLNQMANPIFNDVLGLDPRVIGLVLGSSRIFDALCAPFIGHLTDRTQSRFGRRRPWIAISAVLCFFSYIAIWMFPRDMSDQFYIIWFAVGAVTLFLTNSLFTVSYDALAMELTPDYHERTNIMAYRAVMAKFGGFLVSSIYLIASLDRFSDLAEGMRATSIVFGVVILVFGLAPAIFSREHPTLAKRRAKESNTRTGLWESARITLRYRSFLILAGATCLISLGLTPVMPLGYYTIVYHVFGGEKVLMTGVILTFAGYFALLGSLSGVPVMLSVSRKIGKKGALLLALCVAMFGSLLKWVCYTPANPYLTFIPDFIMAFALTTIWNIMRSMLPDIVDLDELHTRERREGMFSASYTWTHKLAISIALISSGFILDLSGFDAGLQSAQAPETIQTIRLFYTFCPVVAMLGAIALLSFYPLSEGKLLEIRKELENRDE